MKKTSSIAAALAAPLIVSSLLGASSLAIAKEKTLTDWPHIQSAFAKDPVIEAKIAKIVAGMSLAQKIGQMTQPEIKFATPDDVRKYYIGSVLNGGGSWPKNNKYATAADWVKLADQYYAASMSTDMANKVPVIWGIDAVHGNNNVIGATLFPHNIGLGAAHDPKLIGKIATAVGRSVRATGINWVFAPTIAVGKDARWGRSYESFSEDGALVKSYGGVYVQGLQGQFKGDTNVVATAKHFIGDGGTENGVDRGVNRSTTSQMINSHAQGYYSALAAGAQTVMASYNSWYDSSTNTYQGKMHGSKALLTTALKDKMGFDGFVISDWDGIAEVPGCSNDSCPQAINAGVDMVMVPDNWKNFIANTIAQVQRGEIPMARIDDAVSRILRVKLRANLFDKKPSDNPYAGKQDALLAKDLARQAVRESLVLLKNEKQVLPLARGKRILVVGKNADNLANQSGGWSITWQGTENKASDYLGDTILAGIKEAAGEANVHYSVKAEDVDVAQFDVVIAVIGETPYAEGFGDIAASDTLRHSQRFPEDLAVLQKVAGKGKPVITVLVSGRTSYANDLINLSDSFVAAWLPGSEGKGVADVLFKNAHGKVQYPFQGKLSFSWPNVPCLSAPISTHGVASPEKRFSVGYGLKYGQVTKVFPRMDEDSQTTQCGNSKSMAIATIEDSTHFPLSLISATRKVTVGGDISAVAMGSSISLKHTAQGAHLVTWTGAGRYEASAPFATVIPASVATEGVLQFTIQVMQAPQAKISLSMECGEKCQPALDLTATLSKLAGAQPTTIKIPLACFVEKGLKLRQIKTPFSVATMAAFSASFSDIKIVAGAAKDADVLACGDLN